MELNNAVGSFGISLHCCIQKYHVQNEVGIYIVTKILKFNTFVFRTKTWPVATGNNATSQSRKCHAPNMSKLPHAYIVLFLHIIFRVQYYRI
jgi:hypothetical protein